MAGWDPEEVEGLVDALHVRRGEQVQRDRDERPDRGDHHDAAHPDGSTVLPLRDRRLYLFRAHPAIIPLLRRRVGRAGTTVKV
ncbi:hypothetical protein GCM10009743_07220 [Kribbella swartbergensis]